jgi:hypothetical protein
MSSTRRLCAAAVRFRGFHVDRAHLQSSYGSVAHVGVMEEVWGTPLARLCQLPLDEALGTRRPTAGLNALLSDGYSAFAFRLRFRKGIEMRYLMGVSECLPCLAHSGIIFSNLALSSLFFSC